MSAAQHRQQVEDASHLGAVGDDGCFSGSPYDILRQSFLGKELLFDGRARPPSFLDDFLPPSKPMSYITEDQQTLPSAPATLLHEHAHAAKKSNEYLMMQLAVALRGHLEAFCHTQSASDFMVHVALSCAALFRAPLTLAFLYDSETEDLVAHYPAGGVMWTDVIRKACSQRGHQDRALYGPLQTIRVSSWHGCIGQLFRRLVDAEWGVFQPELHKQEKRKFMRDDKGRMRRKRCTLPNIMFSTKKGTGYTQEQLAFALQNETDLHTCIQDGLDTYQCFPELTATLRDNAETLKTSGRHCVPGRNSYGTSFGIHRAISLCLATPRRCLAKTDSLRLKLGLPEQSLLQSSTTPSNVFCSTVDFGQRRDGVTLFSELAHGERCEEGRANPRIDCDHMTTDVSQELQVMSDSIVVAFLESKLARAKQTVGNASVSQTQDNQRSNCFKTLSGIWDAQRQYRSASPGMAHTCAASSFGKEDGVAMSVGDQCRICPRECEETTLCSVCSATFGTKTSLIQDQNTVYPSHSSISTFEHETGVESFGQACQHLKSLSAILDTMYGGKAPARAPLSQQELLSGDNASARQSGKLATKTDVDKFITSLSFFQWHGLHCDNCAPSTERRVKLCSPQLNARSFEALETYPCPPKVTGELQRANVSRQRSNSVSSRSCTGRSTEPQSSMILKSPLLTARSPLTPSSYSSSSFMKKVVQDVSCSKPMCPLSLSQLQSPTVETEVSVGDTGAAPRETMLQGTTEDLPCFPCRKFDDPLASDNTQAVGRRSLSDYLCKRVFPEKTAHNEKVALESSALSSTSPPTINIILSEATAAEKTSDAILNSEAPKNRLPMGQLTRPAPASLNGLPSDVCCHRVLDNVQAKRPQRDPSCMFVGHGPPFMLTGSHARRAPCIPSSAPCDTIDGPSATARSLTTTAETHRPTAAVAAVGQAHRRRSTDGRLERANGDTPTVTAKIKVPATGLPVLCKPLFRVEQFASKTPIGMLCMFSPTPDRGPNAELLRLLMGYAGAQIAELEETRRELKTKNTLLRLYREIYSNYGDTDKMIVHVLKLIPKAVNVEEVALFVADYASRDFICSAGNVRCLGLRFPWTQSLLAPCFFGKKLHSVTAECLLCPKQKERGISKHDDNAESDTEEFKTLRELQALTDAERVQRLAALKKHGSINLEYDFAAQDLITRSALCAPVLNAEGVVMAVLMLGNRLEHGVASRMPCQAATDVKSEKTPRVKKGRHSSWGHDTAETSRGCCSHGGAPKSCGGMTRKACPSIMENLTSSKGDPSEKPAEPPLHQGVTWGRNWTVSGPMAAAAGLMSLHESDTPFTPSLFLELSGKATTRLKFQNLDHVIPFSGEDIKLLRALCNEVLLWYGGRFSRYCMRVILATEPASAVRLPSSPAVPVAATETVVLPTTHRPSLEPKLDSATARAHWRDRFATPTAGRYVRTMGHRAKTVYVAASKGSPRLPERSHVKDTGKPTAIESILDTQSGQSRNVTPVGTEPSQGARERFLTEPIRFPASDDDLEQAPFSSRSRRRRRCSLLSSSSALSASTDVPRLHRDRLLQRERSMTVATLSSGKTKRSAMLPLLWGGGQQQHAPPSHPAHDDIGSETALCMSEQIPCTRSEFSGGGRTSPCGKVTPTPAPLRTLSSQEPLSPCRKEAGGLCHTKGGGSADPIADATTRDLSSTVQHKRSSDRMLPDVKTKTAVTHSRPLAEVSSLLLPLRKDTAAFKPLRRMETKQPKSYGVSHMRRVLRLSRTFGKCGDKKRARSRIVRHWQLQACPGSERYRSQLQRSSGDVFSLWQGATTSAVKTSETYMVFDGRGSAVTSHEPTMNATFNENAKHTQAHSPLSPHKRLSWTERCSTSLKQPILETCVGTDDDDASLPCDPLTTETYASHDTGTTTLHCQSTVDSKNCLAPTSSPESGDARTRDQRSQRVAHTERFGLTRCHGHYHHQQQPQRDAKRATTTNGKDVITHYGTKEPHQCRETTPVSALPTIPRLQFPVTARSDDTLCVRPTTYGDAYVLTSSRSARSFSHSSNSTCCLQHLGGAYFKSTAANRRHKRRGVYVRNDSAFLTQRKVKTPFHLNSLLTPQLAPLKSVVGDFSVDWWSYSFADIRAFFLESLDTFKLIPSLSIAHPHRFLNFFCTIAGAYHSSNPYHNFFHGIQVYHVVWLLLSQHSMSRYLTAVDILGTLLGALCHDVDHPGLNNDFFITIQHPYAMFYNDNSVLENHHCAFSFHILESEKETDFREGMSLQDKRLFRRVFIKGVLATDMQVHSQKTSTLSYKAQRHYLGIESLSIENAEDRMFVVETIIHAADVSNPLTAPPYFQKWASLIVEEFNCQCDREAAMGLEVTAFMNCRTEKARVDCQIGFLEFIALPLWRSLSLIVPSVKQFVSQGEENARYCDFEDDEAAMPFPSNFTFKRDHFSSAHPEPVEPTTSAARRLDSFAYRGISWRIPSM